jgi:hypothetical protein
MQDDMEVIEALRRRPPQETISTIDWSASEESKSRDQKHSFLVNFRRELDSYTVRPDWPESREFINVKHFTEWMTQLSRLGEFSNTHGLLRSLDTSTSFPDTAEYILSLGETRSILVFGILLQIGLGHLVHKFIRRVRDHELPQTVAQLQSHFSSIHPDKADVYAKRFNHAQWKFLPVKFRLGMDYLLSEEDILPVCRKRVISDCGGSARLYSLLVPKNCVEEALQGQLLENGHRLIQDLDYGPVRPALLQY